MNADRQQRAVYDVHAPVAHEGIGRALRGTFCNPVSTLPDDMARLLNKLR